jgi:hypothetical protein
MALILNGTDGLSDVDGTAATPAIRGTDTNTGIFFPAADTIAFSEGGVESMRIDASGNLGIGINSPNNRLQSGYVVSDNPPAAGAGGHGFAVGSNGFGLAAGALNSGNAYLQVTRWDASAVNYNLILQPNGGNLLVGTASAPTGSTGGSGFIVETFNRRTLKIATTTTAGVGVTEFINPNGTVGLISVSGSSTTYSTSSDYRLKENIAPMTGALDVVRALKPVTYNWKVDGSSGKGFIAHELQEVVPECVTGEKDAMRNEQYEISPAIPATYDDEGNELTPAVETVMGEREVPAYQGIDTSFLVATLTAAIQEQQAMIEELKAKVAALEAA